jgi:hypothetical protein
MLVTYGIRKKIALFHYFNAILCQLMRNGFKLSNQALRFSLRRMPKKLKIRIFNIFPKILTVG